MSCTYRRAQEEGKRDARTALAMSALQLSDSMTKKTTAFVTPHFQAWVPLPHFLSVFFCRQFRGFGRVCSGAVKSVPGGFGGSSSCVSSTKAARVKHAKKVKRAAEGTISAMLGSSLSLVFNAWKLMKMSDFQMVQAQLQRREREFNELQEISQSFFTFSQEWTRIPCGWYCCLLFGIKLPQNMIGSNIFISQCFTVSHCFTGECGTFKEHGVCSSGCRPGTSESWPVTDDPFWGVVVVGSDPPARTQNVKDWCCPWWFFRGGSAEVAKSLDPWICQFSLKNFDSSDSAFEELVKDYWRLQYVKKFLSKNIHHQNLEKTQHPKSFAIFCGCCGYRRH